MVSDSTFEDQLKQLEQWITSHMFLPHKIGKEPTSELVQCSQAMDLEQWTLCVRVSCCMLQGWKSIDTNPFFFVNFQKFKALSSIQILPHLHEILSLVHTYPNPVFLNTKDHQRQTAKTIYWVSKNGPVAHWPRQSIIFCSFWTKYFQTIFEQSGEIASRFGCFGVFHSI